MTRTNVFLFRIFGACLFICCFFAALHSRFVFAKGESDPTFDALKIEYSKLRNNDLNVQKAGQWNALAQRFIQYEANHRKKGFGAEALYRAAILYSEVGKKRDDSRAVAKAITIINQLSRDYPGAGLNGEAMLLQADLLAQSGEKDEAKGVLERIITRYKGTEIEVLAMSRRQELLGEKKSTRSSKLDEESDTAHAGVSIVIDPGHGGEDHGAIGPGGIMEKDVALAISLELEQLLTKRLGAAVTLTRRSDAFVPLAERTEIANAKNASLFISIHANASPQGTLQGVETYVLDNTGDKSAKLLAQRENASTQFEAPDEDLSAMLSDLVQIGKQPDSERLAASLQNSIIRHIRTLYGDVHNLGVKEAPFHVLVGAHMPCVLVEIGFIDNKVDGARLSEKAYRKMLAQGLYVGIRRFLDGKEP